MKNSSDSPLSATPAYLLAASIARSHLETATQIFTTRKRSLRRLCFYTCLSVILFTGGGEYLGRYAGTYPPGPGTPLGPGTPPGTRYTPWDQVHPAGPGTPAGTRYTPRDQVHPLLDQVHLIRDQIHPQALGSGTPPRTRYTPLAVHAGRYGQQTGGTHPTGMHSCSQCKHVVRDGWHCH